MLSYMIKYYVFIQGIVKVGAVDADKYKSLAVRFSISGFPTVKIFVDKRNPTDYSGPRTAKGIADAAINAIREKVSFALSGGSDKSGKKSVNFLSLKIFFGLSAFDIVSVFRRDKMFI